MPHAASSPPKMFSRIKDKFSTKKTNTEYEENSYNYSMGNSNSNNTPSHRSKNPFLDTPDEAPPAYESTQKTAPFLNPRGASPAPSISSVTSAEDKYAFLSTFDTIFVIDDSGSMAGRSWREVRDALSAIAPLCTSHDPDGIDVYFLNHRSPAVGSGTQAPGGYFHIRDARQVQRLFESVRPCGSTPTGSRLHSILKPYVSHISHRPGNLDATKPVNIIVITDGCPTDDPESILVHHAKKLDQIEAPPHQVGVQFFQVGNELGATKALRELDDDLAEQGIRDMVDTATWNSTGSDNSKALTADGILKVVLGAVVRRLDRRSTRGSPQGRGH
ncbi:Ff.00g058150.m01.CDS01 [Fusarium sp. VM40]|nr:Ff.00g058150.m01.CDS01 [Fusarium sp. VM40]